MGVFDFDGYFKSNGLEFKGLDPDTNMPIVKTPEGKDVKFDTQGFLKASGIPLDAAPMYNNPTNAINEDPVGLVDRLKLTLGNEKGGVQYLKKRFEDATYSADHGFVVRDKGVWKKVDPSSGVIDDPWEATKDLIEGAVSFVPETAAGVAGATLGAAAGPVGSIAATSAAMGATKGIKNALGMAFGTYTNDENQFVKDVGWEMLMGLGGEATALGAKPAVSKAMSFISQRAAGPVKELIAKSLAPIVNEPAEQILRGMNRAKEVLPEAEAALKKLKAIDPNAISDRAKDILKSEQIELMGEAVKHADAAVTALWNENKTKVLSEVGSGFEANVGEFADSYIMSLVEKGLGKMDYSKAPVAQRFAKELVEKGFVDDRMIHMELLNQAKTNKTLARELAGTFKTLTQDEIIEKRMAEGVAQNLAEDEAKAVQRIADVIGPERFGGVLKGPKGAERLLELQKRLNNDLSSLFDGENNSATKLARDLKTDLMQGIGQFFVSSGRGQIGGVSRAGLAYSELNKQYSQVAPVLANLKRGALSNEASVREAALNNFVPKVGSGIEMMKEMSLLKEVSPAFGALAQKIGDKEAAKAFVNLTPKMEGASLAQFARTAGGGVGTLAGTAGVGAAVPTTPQNLARTISVLSRGNEFLGKIGKSGTAKLLSDPKAMSAFVLTLSSTQSQEDSLTRQLVGGIDQRRMQDIDAQAKLNFVRDTELEQAKLKGAKKGP